MRSASIFHRDLEFPVSIAPNDSQIDFILDSVSDPQCLFGRLLQEWIQIMRSLFVCLSHVYAHVCVDTMRWDDFLLIQDAITRIFRRIYSTQIVS